VLAVLSLQLSACTGFIYNRLDDFIAGYIEDLVTLTDGQSVAMEHWLAGMQRWHRNSEIARYAQFLREFEREAAAPRPAASYVDAANQLESFWDKLVEQSTPEATRLLCGLSSAQADELVASLNEREEKQRRKRAEREPEEATGARIKNLERMARHWIGSLTDAQEQIIAGTAAALPTSDAGYESRKAWRQALRAQLPQTDAGCASPTELARVLSEPERFWTPQYASNVQASRRETVNMVVALDASLTAAQRTRAQRELAEVAATLESLREKQ
jgi:hypothetical protein